jgi:poly-gamma-glutamate synthesis protein (capsule biosynthesis protein)
VNPLPEFTDEAVTSVADQVARVQQLGDLVIASIHWGPNWGYEIPDEQRRFAQALLDRANVSVVHGHSSHHAKAIEIYKNRLILYGCGDFLNDYEGISGYEEFRGDLTLMYFAGLDCLTGSLTDLELVPLQIQRFQLAPASHADTMWLQQTLDRESRQFDVRVKLTPEGRLIPYWSQAAH